MMLQVSISVSIPRLSVNFSFLNFLPSSASRLCAAYRLAGRVIVMQRTSSHEAIDWSSTKGFTLLVRHITATAAKSEGEASFAKRSGPGDNYS